MKSYHLLLILGFAALFSCNEEITVGSSIIEDTTIEVAFTDTVDITMQTIVDDSIEVFRNNFNRRTYMLGAFDDPIFGSTQSDLYLSTRLANFFPLFDTLKIDSVVLYIQLDTLGQFGKENAIHNIAVYQLDEKFDAGTDNVIYGSESFSFNPQPIGEVSKVLNHRDSLEVYLPIGDSIRPIIPQLRIPLDTALWSTIARDTLIGQNAENFKATARGFLIRSLPSENSFAGLNLASDATFGIEMYYSNTEETEDSLHLIGIGAVSSSNFIHNYNGSQVEPQLNQVTEGELYLQAMQGLNIEVDLANVIDFASGVINKATLSFFVLEESDPILPLAQNLTANYIDSNGETQEISDQTLQDTGVLDFLEGDLKEVVIGGQTLKKYDINITNHVVNIIRGNIDNTKILLEIDNKASTASRTVLLGTNHPDYPAQLKLVISNP